MGTSTPNDAHAVPIDSSDHECPTTPKTPKSPSQYIPGKVKDTYSWLKRILHSLGNVYESIIKMFVDLNGSESDESKAYKVLMEQVEEVLVERFPAKLWVVNGVLFALLVVVLTTSVTVGEIRHFWLLNLKMPFWAVFLLVVISGLPAVQLSTLVMSEPYVWIFKMKRYTLLYARMLKRSVDVTLWFTLVFWVWYTWYQPKVIKDTSGAKLLHASVEDYNHTLNIVVKEATRVLMALTIGAFLWTVTRVAFLKLLVDLHFISLCDRIRQTLLDFTTIRYIEKNGQADNNNPDQGSDPINKSSQSMRNDKADNNNGNNGWLLTFLEKVSETSCCLWSQADNNNRNMADAGPTGNNSDQGSGPINIEALDWMNILYLRKETTPIWILKRLIEMYMDYYTNKETHMQSDLLQRLENTDDNEMLMDEADKMLKNVMCGHPNNADIDREVLKHYGLEDKKIDHVFKLFSSTKEAASVQIITQEQFLRWAIKAIKNCKGLKRTIESSQNIFWKLELLLNLCVVVLSLVISLLISEIITTAQIAILFTPFVSASFVFSDSLKKTFDCLLFIFGMHPFNVGDRVIIDKVDLKVEEMYILTTVFTRCDTGVQATYPNFELSSKSIINLEIEPEEFDSIEFFVPYDTPEELICDLQIKIKKTLDDDITFTSDTTVAKKQITNGKKVTMIVLFKYLVTYLSAETRAQHRSKVLRKIIRMCKEMEIEMGRLRNEMKLAIKRRNRGEGSTSSLGEEEEATDILRFQIDVKVKLSKIESLKKNVLRIIQDNNPNLNGCSQAMFTGINKEKITMDVRMRHCTGLFKTDNDINKLKEEIEDAIKTDEMLDQRKGKITTGLFKTNDGRNQLKENTEDTIKKDEKPDQRKEKLVEVSWLQNTDWDDEY